MPHHADDNRYAHLPLIREEPTPERRRQPAPPSPPPGRGGRSRFAGELRGRLDDMETEVSGRPPSPAGIQPHLVFRVPLSRNASASIIAEQLERLGITVVSIENDNAIIAFQNDINLTQFRQAVATYEQGPQQGINPQTGQPFAGTQWDVFEYIEAPEMRLWSRDDRIGSRQVHEIGDEAQSIHADRLYILDVELWHRGTDELGRAAITELRRLVEQAPAEGERLCDSFVGQLLCIARVTIRGSKLDALLDLDIVAEADVPPQPSFDHLQALRATAREFPLPSVPTVDGPSVCVVDSGVVTNHPLLAANVGHSSSILPTTASGADENGHGTMVSGIAVFGDIRACYENGQFSSSVTLYSARVLNADNRFDDQSLIIHQMRRAIETFIVPPYGCRVFNLSLGDSSAWLQHNPRQSLWSESLDILAREYNVILVVSAGNQDFGWTRNAEEAEEILASYPDFLFDPACGLCEPATAAIPITVGGYAQHDASAIPVPSQANDIVRTVALALEPTPTSRVGPGINEAIKPEFVAAGGNVAFRGFSNIRRVEEDHGLAVMSFSHLPTERLFNFDIGTSLAAPQIARLASMVLSNLRQTFGEEPDANLIRALLASSAVLPQPAEDRIRQMHGEDGIRRVYGYGAIDEDVLFDSADRRVTMIAQAAMPLDTFVIYEVPSPSEFRTAGGRKRVIVTLAYDPPVRRRRIDYLGVRMGCSLIRGKTLDEVVEAYRQLSQQERVSARQSGDGVQGAFQSPFKCALEPGPRTLQSSTLQRSEWTFTREGTDYGESWYLVVRSQRTWAPESFTEQRFAVTVTLQADEPELFNLIQNRVRVRQQQRARARQ
jgi:hypothetical protein